MKVINDYEKLVGKTIAFAHAAQFSDQITLVTTENEVFMMEFISVDEFEHEIRLANTPRAIYVVSNDGYLRKEFAELGIFDLEEYKKEAERKQKEQLENYRREQEAKERKLLAELKAKYEND